MFFPFWIEIIRAFEENTPKMAEFSAKTIIKTFLGREQKRTGPFECLPAADQRGNTGGSVERGILWGRPWNKETQVNYGAATKHTPVGKFQSLIQDPFPLPSPLSTYTPPPHTLWETCSHTLCWDNFLSNTDTKMEVKVWLWFRM